MIFIESPLRIAVNFLRGKTSFENYSAKNQQSSNPERAVAVIQRVRDRCPLLEGVPAQGRAR